jgi:Leucine-rich repeat (LRR) protein
LFKTYIRAEEKWIRIIDDQTLVGCSEVEYLELGDNKISEISKNAFQSQQKLRELELYRNQIKNLALGVFDPLTSLTELWLQNNLIEVIDDSLFAKNMNLEKLCLNENKIVDVGPDAFQQLSKLNYLTLYGNPCMQPELTSQKNPRNLGVFFSEASGYRKWSSENNECVSSYADHRSLEQCNIEMQNLQNELIDAAKRELEWAIKYKTLSGTSENLKIVLSETKASNQNFQNELDECMDEKKKLTKDHQNDLLDAKNESEMRRETLDNQTIILGLTIVIILLLVAVVVESVMICKHRTKIADQKERIIRLDRLAPSHIYEQVDQNCPARKP